MCPPHFYTSALLCIPCSQNCEICSHKGCVKCQQNFSLFSNPSRCLRDVPCLHGVQKQNGIIYCSKCPLNCSLCNTHNHCLTCQSGFFLEHQNCQPCMDNCRLCLHLHTCLLCDQGFYFNSKLVECLKANHQSSVTRKFSNLLSLPPTSTLIWQMQIYLGTAHLFQRRDANCVSFDGKGICMFCRLGYFLDFTAKCRACSPLCRICKSKLKCLVCKAHVFTTHLSSGFVDCSQKVANSHILTLAPLASSTLLF